ncbi:MAG TPA: DNA polymerase III subunit [Actinomycetota bacterium]|nr:DNA polymerase III subunit [Actinomycetota bacterium]
MSAVLEQVAGQVIAMAFLQAAAERPHHAYVLAGPEGSGKSIAARAFVAALLCHDGGCGTCRDCSLALRDQHPNEFVVEPEGRDIHIDTIREEVWQPAYRTAPEPGRKVFVIREADRLSPPAADTLLKVLEEPPHDTVFVLLSARAHELPDTISSRCHLVTFSALSEEFVVGQLVGEGIDAERALLVARLSGGNLGRARRMATDIDGLAFRDVAEASLARATDVAGALTAAADIQAAAADYKKGLKGRLAEELAPFLDDRGHPEDVYRGAIRRIETRSVRRERRAERDFIDRVLLAASSLVRDRIADGVAGEPSLRLNVDRTPDATAAASVLVAAAALGALEGARAALAEDMNRNARLVLEHAFLVVAGASATG